MSEDFEEASTPRPDLADRLRRFGTQPVDPATQSAHLTAMASVRIRNRSSIKEKLKVAAALVGGIAIGSTGLAFAGALPPTAQDVASEALARVGVSVPVGTERYFGEECVAAEDGGQARNRGQYLKQERAKGTDALATAKASSCGKPVSSLAGDDEVEADELDVDETNADKPEKCVDGAKVAGKSEGKGKADAANKSSKPCETPDVTGTPAAPAAGGGDEGDGAAEADEPGRSGEVRADDGKGERGKPDTAGSQRPDRADDSGGDDEDDD